MTVKIRRCVEKKKRKDKRNQLINDYRLWGNGNQSKDHSESF